MSRLSLELLISTHRHLADVIKRRPVSRCGLESIHPLFWFIFRIAHFKGTGRFGHLFL